MAYPLVSSRSRTSAFPRVTFEQWTAAPVGDRAALVSRQLSGVSPGWSSTQLGTALARAAETLVEREGGGLSERGQIVVVGGSRSGERFYTPTVLADVTGEMLCAKEETFGPVAPVFKFETEAEVIDLANATEFGLASYFYSRDIGRIFRVGEALEYGMVGVNTWLISTAEVPFGGVKQSGLGREGAHQGMDDYVELKYLCLGDILK